MPLSVNTHFLSIIFVLFRQIFLLLNSREQRDASVCVKLLTCSALLPEPPVGHHGHGAAVEAAGAAARAAARTARTRARAEAGGRAHVTCHGPRDIPATWRVITDSLRGLMVFLK